MIRNDPNYPQLCDDEKLIAVLSNSDEAADHQEIVEHIEQCSRCQQRFDELAAGAQDWTKVRQALLNHDPDSENAAGSAKWDFSLQNEGPIAWTESMASQLLSPPSHPELLGRIGRYDVERLIGSGGMGVVFKAHDTELNRPVAIKILAPYLSGSGPARKRFSREARAAAAVVHEHVVPIYNVETERETPFLVMHYVAGESLQGRIDREGALGLCEILRIGMQVASGLTAAHQQGLVHRDIKPSNILMEQGVERALITDFGLARAADDASLTRTGFHPGTPQYMSPEQASGEQVDSRSDLFSFGSVLYTMCTGRPPFRAETSLGVMRRIADVEPRPIREINPNIPEWLCHLIQKLMAKRPTYRFASAEMVAELLAGCLAHVQQPTTIQLPEALLGATTSPNRTRQTPRFKQFVVAAFAFVMFSAGVLIVLETNKGTLVIQSNADDVPIRNMQGGKILEKLSTVGAEAVLPLSISNVVQGYSDFLNRIDRVACRYYRETFAKGGLLGTTEVAVEKVSGYIQIDSGDWRIRERRSSLMYRGGKFIPYAREREEMSAVNLLSLKSDLSDPSVADIEMPFANQQATGHHVHVDFAKTTGKSSLQDHLVPSLLLGKLKCNGGTSILELMRSAKSSGVNKQFDGQPNWAGIEWNDQFGKHVLWLDSSAGHVPRRYDCVKTVDNIYEDALIRDMTPDRNRSNEIPDLPLQGYSIHVSYDEYQETTNRKIPMVIESSEEFDYGHGEAFIKRYRGALSEVKFNAPPSGLERTMNVPDGTSVSCSNTRRCKLIWDNGTTVTESDKFPIASLAELEAYLERNSPKRPIAVASGTKPQRTSPLKWLMFANVIVLVIAACIYGVRRLRQ